MSQYFKRLEIKIQKTSIRVLKIDESILKTFKIAIVNFKVKNRYNQI